MVVNGLMVAVVIIATLQQIINATWHKETYSVEKLARWVRCLFTLALTSNVETAEHLLDQVESIVEEARKVRKAFQSGLVTPLIGVFPLAK